MYIGCIVEIFMI